MQKNSIGQDGERPCTVTSGQRSSAEAVARDREKSRKRAAAMRAARTAEEHEVHLKERREYEYKNRDHINEARRYNYGEQVDRFANRHSSSGTARVEESLSDMWIRRPKKSTVTSSLAVAVTLTTLLLGVILALWIVWTIYSILSGVVLTLFMLA